MCVICVASLILGTSLAIKDADLTNWFLSCGAAPNAECVLDETPLSHAVQYGTFDVIRTLFDRGGSIEHGQLLHYAVWRNLDDRIEVLRFLIAKGARVNDIQYQHRLASYRRQQPFSLGTPLHYAATKGDLDTVRVLLGYGAELLIKDSRGKTPSQCAQWHGHVAVAELLRSLEKESQSPLHQFTDEMGPNWAMGKPGDDWTDLLSDCLPVSSMSTDDS